MPSQLALAIPHDWVYVEEKPEKEFARIFEVVFKGLIEADSGDEVTIRMSVRVVRPIEGGHHTPYIPLTSG